MYIEGIGKKSTEAINQVKNIVDSLNLNFSSDIKIINRGANSGSPIYNVENKTIYLATDFVGDYYMQAVYQFAHELMHHVIYIKSGISEYDGKVKMRNEILCCAFALFIMKELKHEWYFEEEIKNTINGKSLYSKWSNEIITLTHRILFNREIISDEIKIAIKELKA